MSIQSFEFFFFFWGEEEKLNFSAEHTGRLLRFPNLYLSSLACVRSN